MSDIITCATCEHCVSEYDDGVWFFCCHGKNRLIGMNVDDNAEVRITPPWCPRKDEK